MEARIEITGKKAVKIAGAACLAAGLVALSAVIASGAAVGTVAEGFRSAKNAMCKALKKEEIDAGDEALMPEAKEDGNVVEEV